VITRNKLITILILMVGLAAGYFISRGAVDFLAISYTPKDLSELEKVRTTPPGESKELPLRIVDLGGVGVLPDTANWGTNYEHNQRFFEDVMLVNPPFINTKALEREREKLALYCSRMADFGYNAIALPWFLEYINFDKLGTGQEIYGRESVYRNRHQALGRDFGHLMQLASDSGLQTYLWTDMVALTPPLKEYFEDRFGWVDTENPELWAVYGKAAEEAFEKFPQVEGLIIRIGEAGSIYNKPGWDYTSELFVRTPQAVKLMLEAFLEAAEKYDKTIIFRTWSVGVGKIGDMHTNPETYREVLGGIHSDHLVVSTKYCSGDFYSWLGVNPTLYQGEHRRIAEIQAKREFEGFGSIPNYVAPLHQSALQSILERNPMLEGVWVWTQYGGPLRAGPLIIYPFHGFNVINDVNVYSLSKLVAYPYVDLDSVCADWIRGYFGSDSLLISNFSGVLRDSYDVMKKGLYISEFARYDVRALGLEPPPMLWIFEWDLLGASSAVFSNIYYITREKMDAVLEEGLEAVQGAIAMKDKLLEAREKVEHNQDEYDQLLESLDYEIELFRLLDYYRQYFMHYYHWIDTGDPRSKVSYQLALGQFKAVMDFHQKKYGNNLNTLGMDFDEARTGIKIAEETAASVRWAKVVVVIFIFLLIMGIPGAVRDRANRKFAGTLLFDSLFRPYLISSLNLYHGTRRLVFFLLVLYLLSLVIFSSFSSLLFPVILGILGTFYVFTLSLFIGKGRERARILVSLLAHKVLIMVGILFIVAIRGPLYFWYLFWTSELFKILFISLWVMLIFRKFQVYLILCSKWNPQRGQATKLLVFTLLGVQILGVGVALLVFGMEDSLTALNNELLVLPAGLSKIMGITTHLSIPSELPVWIVLFASGLIVISLVWYFIRRKYAQKATGLIID
jgi:hypothetical protein